MSGAHAAGRPSRQQQLAAMRVRPGAPRLTAGVLAAELTALPGWTRVGKRIEKTFRFADYHATIAFVNAVARIANRQDHHPDLAVHYDRCVVAFSTHDAGGVTLNDCICAAQVEGLGA